MKRKIEGTELKKKVFLAALLLTGSMAAASKVEAAKIRVVTTLPELGDIVRTVAGDLASVDVLARGTEDIHQVVMKPSFVAKLNKADALVYLGLGIEHSFLPGLLAASANPRLRADWTTTCLGEGCVDISAGVAVLEKPDTLSRAEGEKHPQGNPHYNLDPENGGLMARNAAAGLSRIDPANSERYKAGLEDYLRKHSAALAELRKKAAALKGLKAVSYHQDTVYLGRFTGIEFVATVETKPGIAPSPRHLEKLVAEMKEKEVKLIVREQQYEPKTCEWLAERTGAKVAVIGTMAGALPGTRSVADLAERNVAALLEAAGK